MNFEIFLSKRGQNCTRLKYYHAVANSKVVFKLNVFFRATIDIFFILRISSYTHIHDRSHRTNFRSNFIRDYFIVTCIVLESRSRKDAFLQYRYWIYCESLNLTAVNGNPMGQLLKDSLDSV